MVQEQYAFAACLLMCMRSVRPDTSTEHILLRKWALEQFVQGGAFQDENLTRQKGVDFIEILCVLPLYPPSEEDSDEYSGLDLEHGHSLSNQMLIRQMASSVTDTFTRVIPFWAFLALFHSALPIEGFDCSTEYLLRANQLCMKCAYPTTLPLIASFCFKEVLLERVLQRLRDAGCSLSEASPASSLRLMIQAESGDQCDEAMGELSLNPAETTPLLLLVSLNDFMGIEIILKLGVRTDNVSIFTFNPSFLH